MEKINASEFKAKCLALLDEVAETGKTITIFKRGKAVAQLVPPTPRDQGYPQHSLFGTVRTSGDIVSPLDQTWEADSGPL